MRPPVVAVAVAALFAVAAVAPPAAHAQFGGLMKRAAERLVKEPAPERKEITDDQLTKLIAGFTEEAGTADELGRAALANHADVVGQINGYLARKAATDAARRAMQQKIDAYVACTGASSHAVSEVAEEQRARQGAMPADAMAFAQKMQAMSPAERDAFQQKAEALEKRAEAAKASGDLAEQQRVRADLQALTGLSAASAASTPTMSAASRQKMKDASAGMQKCGAAPTMGAAAEPEPDPVMVRGIVETNGVMMLAPVANEAIGDSAAALAYFAKLRRMDIGNRPAERGAAAAGLSVGDYALNRERVLYFFALPAAHGQAPRPKAFSDAELSTLEKHRAELVAAAKRLDELGLQ